MRKGFVHLAAWFSTEFDEVPNLRFLCSGWRVNNSIFAFTREKIGRVTCPDCLADERLAQWTVATLKELKNDD
jgi:hypothetical protein